LFVVMVWYAAVIRVKRCFASFSFSGGFLSGCHLRHSLRYAIFTLSRLPLCSSETSRTAYAWSRVSGPSSGISSAIAIGSLRRAWKTHGWARGWTPHARYRHRIDGSESIGEHARV